MAPTPKPPGEKVRRNIDLTPATKVTETGELFGSPLPDVYDWPSATVAWWETWRLSAQASAFTRTDWSFLVDTAVLHAEFWRGDYSHASELRQRVGRLGATIEDRLKLRMTMVPPDAKPEARLQSHAGRRSRMLKAVDAEAV